MNESERRQALADALAGNLHGWAGLPPGCTAADFDAVSDGESAAGAGRLAGIPVAFRDFSRYPGLLRVFFNDDGHAFLIWADWPPGGAGVAALGPPEVVLSDAPSRRPGTVQHFWGERGVAAYVAIDGSPRGLALFAPTPLQEYLANLGGNEGPPYRPRRSVD